jgi:hypothetical protein
MYLQSIKFANMVSALCLTCRAEYKISPIADLDDDIFKHIYTKITVQRQVR